jgi:hypothetical protein
VTLSSTVTETAVNLDPLVHDSGRPERSGQTTMVHNATAIIAEWGEKSKEGGETVAGQTQ